MLRCKDYGRHPSYTWASNSIDLARSLIGPRLATHRHSRCRGEADWRLLLCLSRHAALCIPTAAGSENKDLLQAAQMSNTCVAVTQIKIDPNECVFGAPLSLHITFDALRPLQNVQWRFSYARDIVGAPDDVVELHRAAPADYAGAAHVACSAQLVGDAANCGVVRCVLHDSAGAELYRLDLVCQVTANEATGQLRRVIHSPLGD